MTLLKASFSAYIMKCMYVLVMLFALLQDSFARLTSSQRHSLLAKHHLVPTGLTHEQRISLLQKHGLTSSFVSNEHHFTESMPKLQSESPVGLDLHDGGTSPVEVILLTGGGFAVVVLGGMLYSRFV